MKATYDSQSNALYIEVAKGLTDHTHPVNESILIDLDKDDQVLGYEFLLSEPLVVDITVDAEK